MTQENDNFVNPSHDALKDLTLKERGFTLIRSIASYTMQQIQKPINESIDMLEEGIDTSMDGSQGQLVDFWQKSCKLAEASSCILGQHFISERPSAGNMWRKVNSDTKLSEEDISIISRNLKEIQNSIDLNSKELGSNHLKMDEKDFVTILDAIPLFDNPSVSFHSSNLLMLFTDIKIAENDKDLSRIKKSDEYLANNIYSIEDANFSEVEKHLAENNFASESDLQDITSQIKRSNRDYNISPLKPRNRVLYNEDEIKPYTATEIIKKAIDRAVVFKEEKGLNKKQFRNLDGNPYFVQIIGEAMDKTNQEIGSTLLPRMDNNFNKEEDILEQKRMLTDVGEEAYVLSTKFRDHKSAPKNILKEVAEKGPSKPFPVAELLKNLRSRVN